MGKIMLVLITAVGVLGMIFGVIVALRGKDTRFNKNSKWVRVLGLTVSALAIVFFSGVLVAEIVFFDDLKPASLKMEQVMRSLRN
ncbi:hypothetical protein KA183_17635 [bacterium]|nr:hypothetical protein [bacterium]